MRPLPPGYKKISLGRGWAVVRDDWLTFISAAARAGSVAEFTFRRDDARLLHGRGHLHVSRDPRGQAYVVRRLRHGGLLAPITGERFWIESTPRPLNELLVSVALAQSGVSTPGVIAACVYPGRWTYTGEVVREYVADARDLADFMFDPTTDTGERTRMLAATSELIEQLGKVGLHHPDLNMRNVLVAPASQPTGVMIIDLEKGAMGGAAPRSVPRMTSRFLRSARKLCQKNNALWHGHEWSAFEKGMGHVD